MKGLRRWALCGLLCMLGPVALTQTPIGPRKPGPEGDKFFGKKEKAPETTRSVSGAVLDPEGNPVQGAVVQLKDLKTLRVRSFISLEDGTYRFHGLSTDVEYELQARYGDMESERRRLSVYDSRQQVTMNLKLRRAKEEKKDESS